MDRKTVTAECKHCGKKFNYSQEAYDLRAEGGDSKPRRCDECSKKHGKRIKSFFSPYFSFSEISDGSVDMGRCDHELAFHGRRIEKKQIKKADQSGMDISITDKEIIELYQKLEQNQVVVMVSPTGTGKSTYVPKRLVQAPDGYEGDFVDRLIRQGQIIVTQPRIMATDGTGKTTAKISGELFGRRGMFGIRHSKDKESFSAWNKCVSVTDGTLPNWIREGKLGQYSLIMVDEAHERSCNIDLILGFLKRELPKYPQLRVIISSATINAQKFLESFREAGISCELFDIPSRKKFKKFEHFWKDESVSPKCNCWLCKKPVAKRREFWEGKRAPLGRYDLPEACANFTLKILEETSQGSIIVFLDGAPAIEDACSRIRSRCRKGIEVVPVYRERKDAKKELERTAGKRRVIVATNIAETSITIPDLVYCINSGWIKQVTWNPEAQAQKLESKLHSKDGNSQRGGRLGRNQDGYVYHLFTKQQWEEELDEHTSPEITRSCLDDSLTKLKAAGITETGEFPWMEKVNEWDDMAKEMQRAGKSLSERGVADLSGHIVEKALSLMKISRSSTEASVLFSADEQGILFETAVALLLISDKEGKPHAGSNLYDPFSGLLCWNSSWTAATKSKVWAIHQGLKIGCRDDLDFVVKLAYCFQRAGSNGMSKEWADYHCVNLVNLGKIISDIKDLIDSLGDEREESQRQLNLYNLDKVRMLFLSAWPDRVINLISAGDQILYGSGPVSPNCAGNWENEERALAMAFIEEESAIGNVLQRWPTASFMISLSGKKDRKDLFLDQRFPVGCWIETGKKDSKTVLLKVLEIPPALKQSCKRDVWYDETPDTSIPFSQFFLFANAGDEPVLPEGYWMKGAKSGKARIIRWAEEKGISFAILSPFSESELRKFAGKVGGEMEVKIHRIIRDPVSKNGFALARIPEFEIPIEFSEMSLSDYGAGLELIEGETLPLIISGYDKNGFPRLSNLKRVMDDLASIAGEISESGQKTRGSERSFIDLSGILVEIVKDEEKAVVAIRREGGVIQVFDVNQTYVPGNNLKYLRLNKEITVRLLPPNNGVEVDVDCLFDDVPSRPKSWKEGKTENKISVPACLADKDLAKWNARPEAVDYVKRRSWQYCLQARVVSLKSRMSALEEWMSVKAVVERISHSDEGQSFVHVVFGDNIPASIPENRLSSSGHSVGDELSLCITSLEPLRLSDRDMEIRQKEETIVRWKANISSSEDYISDQEERRSRDQAKVLELTVQLFSDSPKWQEIHSQWIAESNERIAQRDAKISGARQQVAEWKEKISSVRRELKKLKGG